MRPPFNRIRVDCRDTSRTAEEHRSLKDEGMLHVFGSRRLTRYAVKFPPHLPANHPSKVGHALLDELIAGRCAYQHQVRQPFGIGQGIVLGYNPAEAMT